MKSPIYTIAGQPCPVTDIEQAGPGRVKITYVYHQDLQRGYYIPGEAPPLRAPCRKGSHTTTVKWLNKLPIREWREVDDTNIEVL